MLKEKKLGVTYDDKQIKQFGVKNSVRAKYINEQINSMDKESAKVWLKSLRKKKILTDEVWEQFKKIRSVQNVKPTNGGTYAGQGASIN